MRLRVLKIFKKAILSGKCNSEFRSQKLCLQKLLNSANYFGSQKFMFDTKLKILSSLAIWLNKNIGFIHYIIFRQVQRQGGKRDQEVL
jgi:hypothetical protein